MRIEIPGRYSPCPVNFELADIRQHRSHDTRCHTVLQLEKFVAPTIVALAPDVTSGYGFNNTNEESQPRARVSQPADQEISLTRFPGQALRRTDCAAL